MRFMGAFGSQHWEIWLVGGAMAAQREKSKGQLHVKVLTYVLEDGGTDLQMGRISSCTSDKHAMCVALREHRIFLP